MNVQAVLALIDGHLQEENWEGARDLCQQILESNPGLVKGYQRLGQAWAGLGQFELAIDAYHHCLRLQPNQSNVYADIGFLYQQSLQFSNAIAHYQKALHIKPTWIEVRFNLAMIYHRLGDWNAAIEEYEQVLVHRENHVKARFNLAILYEQTGKFQEAELAYRQVITRQPKHHDAFSNLGTIFFHREQYETSLEMYREALKIQPDSAQILNNIGQVYLAQDNLEEAIQSHQKAIAIDPFLVSSRLTLGRLWFRHQHYEKAKLCFQIIREQSPHNIDANHDLGKVHVALGEWTEAFDCFRQVVSQQQSFVDLFCQRVASTVARDCYEIAKVECSTFLQALKTGDTSEGRHSLGQCYRFFGQTLLRYGALAQAEQYFYQALQLQPQQSDIYLSLADCLLQQSRLGAAVATVTMGLAIQPKDPQLTAQLSQLQQMQSDPPRQNDDEMTGPCTPGGQRFYSTTQDWVNAIAAQLDTQPRYKEVTVAPAVTVAPSTQKPEAKIVSCGGVTCAACMKNLIDLFEPRSLSKDVFECVMTPKACLPPPTTFVVEIPHGRAWISPQENEWLICKDIAIVTEDQSLLGDLSRFYPWYLPGCVAHDMTQHRVLKPQEALPSPQFVQGRVAVLSGLSGHVYYHWMIDVLPRVGLLQTSGVDFNSIDKFVVNSVSKPFQRETLEKLGIPLEKVIESDRIPHLTATELVVPSFPGHLDWVPSATIEFLRASFLTEDSTFDYRRIYVSRSGAKYRQVVNEPDVMNLLAQYGFVSLNLETYSVIEQAQIFAGAEVIIAPHGAALTNLVFCRQGTKVIEFFAPDYVRTDYWMISHQLQLEHYFIKGAGFKGDFLLKLMHQNSLTEDMWIDLESLYLAMNRMGLERC